MRMEVDAAAVVETMRRRMAQTAASDEHQRTMRVLRTREVHGNLNWDGVDAFDVRDCRLRVDGGVRDSSRRVSGKNVDYARALRCGAVDGEDAARPAGAARDQIDDDRVPYFAAGAGNASGHASGVR